MQRILAKNDAGDHFPLYAICLGFELLTMIISQVAYVSHDLWIFCEMVFGSLPDKVTYLSFFFFFFFFIYFFCK
jgi:hypothetical protein